MTPQPGAIVRVVGRPKLVGLVTFLSGTSEMEEWEWLVDDDGDPLGDDDPFTIVILGGSGWSTPGTVYNVGADNLEVVGQLEGVECE